MSEESAKHIHIEDGNAETEAAKAAEAETADKAEEASEKAVPDEGTGAENAESAEKGETSEEEIGKETGQADSDPADDNESEDTDAEESGKEDAAEQESERYMRLMAEFQNFKRRAAKEKSDIHAFANERIVSDLLPVLDNFERALETETDDIEAYAKGMQLIFEQLKTALEKAGLKEIEALGCDFDPNLHNAVMTDNTDEYENDKISKVLQKGYKLNDRVVRPSMVAVNKK